MTKHNHWLRIVAMFGAVTMLVSTTDAHHTAAHDQNPNPPPVLGATTILHFEAGSLIIPMDICYARDNSADNDDQDRVVAYGGSGLTHTTANCLSNSQKDDGLVTHYTLAFKLIQDGVPVNWSIKAGKGGWNDVDFSVVKAGGGPVTWDRPGVAVNTTQYAALTTIKYRGAPFVIDVAYAAQAAALVDAYAASDTAFKDVDIHVAQVGFDAPIYKTITALPKLALVDIEDTDLGLHATATSFLGDVTSDANMESLEGTIWEWIDYDDIMAGDGTDYDLLWIPSFDTDNPAMPNAVQEAFIDKLAEAADAGTAVLFEGGAMGALEGYGTMNVAGTVYTQSKAGMYNFMSDGGFVMDGISSSWDNGVSSSTEVAYGTDYSDPPAQAGGSHWTGIGGSKVDWKPRYDKAYLDGVRRMVYSHDTNAANDAKRRWDFGTWRYKDNDQTKGRIFYLGGDHWRATTHSGFRIVMNTLLVTTPLDHTEITEIQRSSPVVAIVGGTEAQYTGTLEVELPPTNAPTYSGPADEANFEFPWQTGHMRAVDMASLADGETAFEDLTTEILWDANEHIPSINYTGAGCGSFPADGTCRRIFTDRLVGDDYEETFLVTDNSDTLMTSFGVSDTSKADFLIGRIHQGHQDGSSHIAALGGVDRSTPAVIEPSPLIPNGRPTMVYFGGTDGMLHAVCAEVTTGCPAAGVELWAYMPSSELGHVRLNETRIDGSPKVADVFGRFGTAREYRTVLVFQTGNQDPSATYALDVTDPTEPDVLWKHTTNGPGSTVSMGWVTDNSTITPMVFLQSALNPSGTSSGYEVTAVETVTGDVRWTRSFVFPSPRDPSNDPPPKTAVPGGVTVIANDDTTVDSLLVGTLYGQVYRLDPLDGDNVYGGDSGTNAGTAMFDFGEDFHPIGASVSLYRSLDDGLLRALVVSGGFADPFAPSATEWAPDDVNQYGVGFPALTDDVPITRAEVEADNTLGIHIDFGAGQRAFSPGVVAGDEVFITTDTTAVNASDYGTITNTGQLWRKNLSDTSAATYVTVPSGAAAVDVSISTGTVVSGGFSSVQVTRPSGFDAVGASTEAEPSTSSTRRLWLRTQ